MATDGLPAAVYLGSRASGDRLSLYIGYALGPAIRSNDPIIICGNAGDFDDFSAKCAAFAAIIGDVLLTNGVRSYEIINGFYESIGSRSVRVKPISSPLETRVKSILDERLKRCA